MNAIQIKERVEFYLDTERNGRFSFSSINKGVNDAIVKYVDDLFGDIENKNIYGLQSIQQIRDNLYTLIKTSTLSPTTLSPITTDYGSFIVNHINDPADYYEFVALQTLISGITSYARPTTWNELTPLLEDSLKMPTNKRLYYVDDSTGYQIYRGNTGTLTSANLTYVKIPDVFSIGSEYQLINQGIGVLTLNLDYIAVQESVVGSTTYLPGEQFTTPSVTLVSGQVILASNTTTCNLPEKTHEQIAIMAAEIMSGNISDFNRAAFATKEAKGN